MTAHTIASITSLIDSKTVTIEFKAFGFLAIAKYFFTQWIRFRYTEVLSVFFMIVWTLNLLLVLGKLCHLLLVLLFFWILWLRALLLLVFLFLGVLLWNNRPVRLALSILFVWTILAITFMRRFVPLNLAWNSS